MVLHRSLDIHDVSVTLNINQVSFQSADGMTGWPATCFIIPSDGKVIERGDLYKQVAAFDYPPKSLFHIFHLPSNAYFTPCPVNQSNSLWENGSRLSRPRIQPPLTSLEESPSSLATPNFRKTGLRGAGLGEPTMTLRLRNLNPPIPRAGPLYPFLVQVMKSG